jgi:hypothetical protein
LTPPPITSGRFAKVRNRRTDDDYAPGKKDAIEKFTGKPVDKKKGLREKLDGVEYVPLRLSVTWSLLTNMQDPI